MKRLSSEDKQKFLKYQEDIKKAKEKRKRKEALTREIHNISSFFSESIFKKITLLFFGLISVPIILVLFLVYGTRMILGI